MFGWSWSDKGLASVANRGADSESAPRLTPACVTAQARAVGQDILVDIIVGRGTGPVAKAVRLQPPVRLGMAPALVFHAIDRRQNAGAVQSCLAMDQDRVNRLVVHQMEKLVDGHRALPRDKMA